MTTRPELVGYFSDFQGSRGRHDNVKKQFETLCGEPRGNGINHVPAHHEEPAHRVADMGTDQTLGRRCCDTAEQVAHTGEPSMRLAACCKSRSNGEICAQTNSLQHSRQHGLVVLQVPIHYGHRWGRACQQTFDTGPGKPAPANASHAADTRIRIRDRTRCGRSSVWAVIIDKDHLPFDADESLGEPFDHKRHVLGLVEGGDDDGELWC